MVDPCHLHGDHGAAWRRRQRRLRSWLRHVQRTVPAVLAAVTHHSYPKVDTAHDGLRAQRTVTSGTEDRRQGQGGGGARDVQRATAPEDSTSGDAAMSPTGARAAGEGSHGRVRGCPGASSGGGVAGWRRRGGRHHRLLPPEGCAPAEGGEEGEGEAGA